MRTFNIGHRTITDESPCFVIAELGCNHGGSVDMAYEMLEKAYEAGVDAVKLQKRDVATLYSQKLLEQPYDNENSYGLTYGAHREALELSARAHGGLYGYADFLGMVGFSTAFDEPSVDFLLKNGAQALKLASAALTDGPLLTYAAETRMPLVLSTGGGTQLDIEKAANLLAKVHPNFALLHCTAAYPTDFCELNLLCIRKLLESFPDTVIGWSGHDSGIAMAVAAYALGARIIEKHFTLNRAMKGTDHAFSIEPAGMKRLCRDLSRAHVAMGDGVKRWYDSERKPLSKMRRVLTKDGTMRVTGELVQYAYH